MRTSRRLQFPARDRDIRYRLPRLAAQPPWPSRPCSEYPVAVPLAAAAVAGEGRVAPTAELKLRIDSRAAVLIP